MTLIIKTTGWEDYLVHEGGGAYVKALLMGPPGAGKTRSASFWPRPIFADCEQGRMSIADRGVPYAEIRSTTQMDLLLDTLKRECAKGPQRAYDTFVVDTLDSYQRTVIQERLAKERKEALTGWADWGYLDAKMTQFVERLLNLPMNIVVNLHVKETTEGDEAADSKRIVMAPKLKGDLRDQIAAEFDLVGFMETHWEAINGQRTLTRSIRWFPEPKYPMLKDRSGKLPRFTTIDFTDDDFERIRGAILGDHLDQMPSTAVVETIEEPEVLEAAGPDVAGGPVATVQDFPRRKSDLQPVPPADPTPPAPEVGDATSAPPKKSPKKPKKTTDVVEDAPDNERSQDVPAAEAAEEPAVAPESTHVEAVEAVVETLGGEVVSETAPVEEKQEEGPFCGDQPETMKGQEGWPGCGKSLANPTKEEQRRINLSILRAKSMLCSDCVEKWKAAN